MMVSPLPRCRASSSVDSEAAGELFAVGLVVDLARCRRFVREAKRWSPGFGASRRRAGSAAEYSSACIHCRGDSVAILHGNLVKRAVRATITELPCGTLYPPESTPPLV